MQSSLNFPVAQWCLLEVFIFLGSIFNENLMGEQQLAWALNTTSPQGQVTHNQSKKVLRERITGTG